MCFNLHTLTGPFFNTTTAQEAVSICQSAFNQENWGGSYTPGSGLPTTANELFLWYIFEIDDEEEDGHLWFGGRDTLTRELAKSEMVADIRQEYYLLGDVPGIQLYKFNHGEFLRSILIDSGGSWFKASLPISSFLGSFWYQVVPLPNGRIGFRIDNDTTMESGTHIAGRYRPDYRGSVKELIDADPSLGNRSISEVIRSRDVISILPRQSRDGTSGSFGGGDMYQTFTWTEAYLECSTMTNTGESLNYRWLEVFLDFQAWDNFSAYTEAVDFTQ